MAKLKWLLWLFMRIILEVVTAYSSLVSKQPRHRLKVTIYLYRLGHGVIFDPNTILRLSLTSLCKIVQLWSYILASHYIRNTFYCSVFACACCTSGFYVTSCQHILRQRQHQWSCMQRSGWKGCPPTLTTSSVWRSQRYHWKLFHLVGPS